MNFALVLGSGGARGFAHIGVLKVLEDYGLKPSLIVGTSIGSIIGGLYALNPDARAMALKAGSFVKNKDYLKLLSMGFKQQALLSSAKVKNVLKALFGDKTFRDCEIPFKAIATNLQTGREKVLDKGLLSIATLASSSVPGLLPPTIINEELLVDGALVNPLPIDIAVKQGFKNVIAVDLTPVFRLNKKRLKTYEILISSLNILIKSLTMQTLKRFENKASIKIIQPFMLTEHAHNMLRFDKGLEMMDLGVRAAKKMLSYLA
ncbi:patatin-like phospholipase family protein [Candidatus Woesearchaeota archaeon]|nr:patatin-like phospholipase family protein [Candidatus Woesearchaeota archaeon]